MEQKNNKKAIGIVAIVLGAVGIVLGFEPFASYIGLIAAIVGLVLAVKTKKAYAASGEVSPIPKVGFILSIIGLIIAAIFSIIWSCTIVCTGCYVSSPEGQKVINDALATMPTV